jgi:hypothetical protein
MGFRKYRTEAATAAEKRPNRMVTFFVKVDANNGKSDDIVEKDQ